jgi:uncharacterized membrane protein
VSDSNFSPTAERRKQRALIAVNIILGAVAAFVIGKALGLNLPVTIAVTLTAVVALLLAFRWVARQFEDAS